MIRVRRSLPISGVFDDLIQRKWTAPTSSDSSLDGVPTVSGPNREPHMQMIGDFDNSANALWTLYGEEAKSHDEARIQSLKDDMDGVLIFVRSYPYFNL